jgi:hypothetical protein
MKLLVIAYEFSPVLSGQSIRWFHLANAMADLEADVHLLVPAFPDRHRFSGRLRKQVTVHRCWPGPFIGLAGRLSEIVETRANARHAAARDGSGEIRCTPPSRLESTYRIARAILDHLLFPDVRTEWFPVAITALRRLMRLHNYDVIVSSHEPGVTLLLGLAAQRHGRTPWLVDMGDPVLGPRTPRWRLRLDRAFERIVCARADGIIVTCPEMIDLLLERHGQRIGATGLRQKLAVIRQGFVPPDLLADTPTLRQSKTATPPDHVFTLLFTGTFYGSFRTPARVLEALAHLPCALFRLVVAGNTGRLEPAGDPPNEHLRVLGMIDHLKCLELQRQATMLLNVGNEQSYQIPGKLFEYFGAQRPILHLASAESDPAAALIRALRRGLVVRNEPEAIRTAITKLYDSWCSGDLDSGFDLSLDRVQEYAWPALAGRVLEQCEMLSEKNRGSSQ